MAAANSEAAVLAATAAEVARLQVSSRPTPIGPQLNVCSHTLLNPLTPNPYLTLQQEMNDLQHRKEAALASLEAVAAGGSDPSAAAPQAADPSPSGKITYSLDTLRSICEAIGAAKLECTMAAFTM